MPSQPMQINLIKGDKVTPGTDYLDALAENMYAIARPMLGAAGYMQQHPGLTEYGTGVGPDRGGAWNERQQQHFRVSYSQFIVVAADGSNTRYGTIPGTSQASMPYSFNTQAVIVDGNFYLYDAASGFRQVTDSDVKKPIDGTWTAGYYVLTDGEYLYHTKLSDEMAIEPLAFATAEFSPDQTLGVATTSDDKVIVFGRYTTEFFANTASTNFAFTRIPGRAIKIGIVATHAKCELKQMYYLCGSRKEGALGIHVLGAGTSEQVSTRSIDKILGKYTDAQLANMTMEARIQDGNAFVYVHLPNETLLFNETIATATGLANAWTIVKRGTAGDPWRGINGIFDPRLGKWVYGDKIDLRIGILDDLVTTQYGQQCEWVLYTPFLYLEDMSIDSLDIETISGESAFRDATVFLSMTYDGATYGKEYTMLYGEPGARNQRFIANRLGFVRNWCGFKLRGVSSARMAFGRGFISVG
jgi:hypothetical protein